MPADLVVEAFIVIGAGHGVDRVHVQRLDDGGRAHVAELRDLASALRRNLAVAAAEQDIRLDADRLQLLHRMLGRLGLQLAGGRDPGDQGQVHEHGAFRPKLVAELADRLQERQALDVADRAADLAEHEVLVGDVGLDPVLDRVGHVRDHLDRGAEIVAAPLFGDHVLIDPAGGDAVRPAARDAGEALVMAEIEIGLRPVVGDVDLAVLIRAHRARIDVEIGVELAQANLESACLQQSTECCRRKTLAERGDHAAGDEYETRHGRSLWNESGHPGKCC